MIHTKLNVCYIHVIWKRIYHIYVFGGGVLVLTPSSRVVRLSDFLFLWQFVPHKKKYMIYIYIDYKIWGELTL